MLYIMRQFFNVLLQTSDVEVNKIKVKQEKGKLVIDDVNMIVFTTK